MKTLIIHDTTGFIISRMCGDVREPIGVPFLWTEIPDGKYAERVDVSGAEHKVILIDLPKSENQTMQEKINLLTLGYAEIIGGGI